MGEWTCHRHLCECWYGLGCFHCAPLLVTLSMSTPDKCISEATRNCYCLFSWYIITKHSRLGSLNSKNCLWVAGNWRSKWSWLISFQVSLSLVWMWLLNVSHKIVPHSTEICVLISEVHLRLDKDISNKLIWLNYLFEGCVSKYSHILRYWGLRNWMCEFNP